jgi:hypothetical protein
VTDPVQSIRVAGALADRFRDILTGPRFLNETVSEFEVRIGEAQQIYPEIWRHLDEARAALVAAGVDTSAFDDLRRGELAQLGVTDIDSSTAIDFISLFAGQLNYAQVKTAAFNVKGYKRAVAACNALMAAMPEVDWAGLARKDAQEIAAAGSLHANKWLGIIKWLAIAGVVAAVAYGIFKLATRGGDPELRRANEEMIAKQEADVRELEDRKARRQRIADVREAFESTCDPKQRAELARLLRDSHEPAAAQSVEAEACPPPADCNHGLAEVERRVHDNFDAVEGDSWVSYCRAGKFGGKPGLAIAINALTTRGAFRGYRGIALPRGKTDLVPFAMAPATIDGLEIADLDGDGTDELVTSTSAGLVVSRLRDGKLVDIATLPVATREGQNPCVASVSVQTLLELDIDRESSGPGCPKPGHHVYVLDGDRLVERKR